MRRVFRPGAQGGARHFIRLNTFVRGARRAFALLAAAALLNLAGPAGAASARATSPAPYGQVTAAEGLTLDGSPAVAGQTFFTGSTLGAAEGRRPALALANLARLELAGGSSLRLVFTETSVGGALDEGGARVYAPRGVAASVTTADATVLSDAEAGPSVFSVQLSEEGTKLTVQAGRVEMRAGGRALTAAAGESLWAARGSAPQPGPPQGHNLSGEQKAWLWGGIAAAVTAIIIIIAGQDDDDEGPEIPCPIPGVSPTSPVPPGC